MRLLRRLAPRNDMRLTCHCDPGLERLMSRPKLIMFDEPSLGLSPLLVQDLFNIVETVNREGVTVLLVEQNVKHTLSMCDRAYVLENGRITLSGTGVEFLDNDHVREACLGI